MDIQHAAVDVGQPALKAWQAPEISDVASSSPMMGGFRLDDEPVNEDCSEPGVVCS